MSAGLIGRALNTLESLAETPGGIGVQELAKRRSMPIASMHRMLGELSELGFVRQMQDSQKYVVTTKLISLGFRCLAANGVTDFAQPILDDLATATKELVRLAIVDGERLTWVAKAQGAKAGLRYDPDMGRDAVLFCTATGQAWLSCLSEESALQTVAAQGFGDRSEYGPGAPGNTAELLERLRETRERGYAQVIDSAAVGTSAMAAAIYDMSGELVVGTVSIAGPSVRMDDKRMAEFAPALLDAARELSSACQYTNFQ